MNKNLKRLAKNKNIKAGNSSIFFKKISANILLHFTRDLSVMLNAKMPLTSSLKLLAAQSPNEEFKHCLKKIIRKIEKGQSFSQSLKQHSHIFDELYVQIVFVGESADILGQVLAKHASYLERTQQLKKKILKALIYPAIVIVTAIFAITFLLLFVIPTFSEIFSDMNAQLPPATANLLKLSKNLPVFIIGIIIIIFILIYIIKILMQSKSMKSAFDKSLLKLPLLGSILQKNIVTQFCRTVGTLVANGLPLTDSISISSKTITNLYIRKKLRKVYKNVEKGLSFASSMKNSGIFSAMLNQMIQVGETTDNMAETLIYIADSNEEEIDSLIDTLTSIIEPVLIIVLGIIIAGLLIALYLPMFEIVNAIGI